MKNATLQVDAIRSATANWLAVAFQQLLAEPVRNGVYKPKQFHGRGVKVINMGELFAYDFISSQEMKRIELSENEKVLVKDGDLLFARRSLVLEGSGKCTLVVEPAEETTFESSIVRARLDRNKADPRFYYYLFRSPIGRALMSSIASQTAVSGITGTNLVRLVVPHPPLSTQRRIADVLLAYDELIENNTRRIKILEEMAQALYREWFLHFRFPDHEGIKLVESPLGEIPKGWEIKKLGEIAGINASSIKRDSGLAEIDYVDIASVVLGRIEKTEHYSLADAPGRARRVITHGDTIWSCVRPNRRSYALILNPKTNLIVSTGFATISPKTVPYTYLYHVLTTDVFVGYLTNRARGAAYPAVTADDFREASVLRPPDNLLDEFHELCTSHFDLIQSLSHANATLRQTRDQLLPKLIAGEVNVSPEKP